MFVLRGMDCNEEYEMRRTDPELTAACIRAAYHWHYKCVSRPCFRRFLDMLTTRLILDAATKRRNRNDQHRRVTPPDGFCIYSNDWINESIPSINHSEKHAASRIDPYFWSHGASAFICLPFTSLVGRRGWGVRAVAKECNKAAEGGRIEATARLHAVL